MKNEKVNIESLKYQNDNESYDKRKANLKILICLGYLSYDSINKSVFIPNQEIYGIFKNLIQSKIWSKKDDNSNKTVFNPGEFKFCENLIDLNYIDKTEMILELNKYINSVSKKNLCVTRPRRFGKTITANMLTAYYSYSESKITVFDDKKISKSKDWDQYLGKFIVIKLNMIDYFLGIERINEGIEKIKNIIIKEGKKNGINFEFKEKESYDILNIMNKIQESTRLKIIIIIDEWDIVLRNKNYDENSQKIYLEFLTLLIKDKNYTALTYMTGILPIKNYGLNSGLAGAITEYSMTTPGWISKYIGFTDNEVKKLCNKYIKKQSDKNNSDNNLNEEINYKNIKYWYDGYHFIDEKKKIYEIYSPYSIMTAFKDNKIDNYWVKSELMMISRIILI